MLAAASQAATSLFARSAIYQNYSINVAPLSSPTPSSSSLPVATLVPPFQVGLWKVQTGFHKTTLKRVSIWTFDRRNPEVERLPIQARERVLEVLKTEAQSLRRMRHPCILEMSEPLEESRTELVFATEPLLASLSGSIKTSPQDKTLVDLDEIEIQKGILQLCKALSFLHDSAKLIHSNVNPNTILINAAGDWKLGGLGLTIPLAKPDGSLTRWEYPEWDRRMPSYVQRSFDYMAPEYAIDEQLSTISDMYSLGVVIYAVHLRGLPPFRNHGSIQNLRENAGRKLGGMERLDQDLQKLLQSMITRTPHIRPTTVTLPSVAFFSSLQVSTLNFLDRSTFAAKPREEKIAFMKGLNGVLDRFSDGLKERKLLPSLLEEMKDVNLIPAILPNVFAISRNLSAAKFSSLVLPGLKPLFILKDPPQNMLTLIDNISILQEKTDKLLFKSHCLPLIYNALDSEHAAVQEQALKAVPSLSESIDYAEVQGVLFPKVAMVFTKTRFMSVKVQTLECFLSLVKVLDQSSLTRGLVPLLSKIRTRVKPAVMLGTLNVQEALGLKVDREAVATLVLPQLWTLSMGPMLSLGQFSRFMEVIRKLGERVEKEHTQYLRDHQRTEDRTSGTRSGAATMPEFSAQPLTFESLVNRSTSTIGNDTKDSTWNDDVWDSILGASENTVPSTHAVRLQAQSSPPFTPQSVPAPLNASNSRFGQTSSASNINGSLASPNYSPFASRQEALNSSSASSHPGSSGINQASTHLYNAAPAIGLTSRPNYNLGLNAAGSTRFAPLTAGLANSSQLVFGPALIPTKVSSPESTSKLNADWAKDFDPLG